MKGKKRNLKERKNGDYKGPKKYKNQGKAVILRTPQICPDVMRVKLPYVSSLQLDGGGVATLVGHVYRLNSIFDPDFTGVGSQPLGHDQWAAFYRSYRVRGCKITIRAMSDSAQPCTVGIVPLNTNTILSTREQYQEQTKSKFLPVGIDTSNGVSMFSSYGSVAEVYGGPSNIVDYDDNFRATMGTNPTTQLFWHVFATGFGTGNSNFDVQVQVELEYYVDLFQRETLSRS